MAAGKRRPSTKKAAPDLDELVVHATSELERTSHVLVSKLGPAALRPQIAQRLASAGFEVTKTQVRVPLSAQLAAALEGGATIALSGVKAHLAGASAAEIKATIQQAVTANEAVQILRGAQLTLVRPHPGVLTPEELRQLKRGLDAMQKTLAAALKAKPPASLLRSDLDELLPRLGTHSQQRAEKSRPEIVTSTSRPTLERVLSAVGEATEGSLGLAFVPRVIGNLAPELAPESVREALLEAARAGSIELRPEGGLARLSMAELEVCPKGAMGAALAWARRVEQTP